MIIMVPCMTARATPDAITRPRGTTVVCVDVQCDGPTTAMTHAEIPSGTVTFCDGSRQTLPVPQACGLGTTRVCLSLCFEVGPFPTLFTVFIVVNEPGDVVFKCPVNIKVP